MFVIFNSGGFGETVNILAKLPYFCYSRGWGEGGVGGFCCVLRFSPT